MAVTEETRAIELPDLQAGPSRGERFRQAAGTILRSRVAVTGLGLIMFWVIVALFADNCIVSPQCWIGAQDFEPTPWLARYSPFEQISGRQLQGPSAQHWLGTDRYGRDLWARLVYGSRIILTLAPLSVGIALVVGAVLGLVSAYYGGLIDEAIMRAMDAVLAFPNIVLYLVILAALGPSRVNVVAATTIAGVPGIARLVRGLGLDIKTRDFVAAAETRGEPALYIMFFEILPNAWGPIIIDAMLRVGYVVFAIATLGFLGLGLPPPSPDWGSMVNTGRRFIQSGHPWGALWGALAAASLVVGLNLLADGLREEVRRYG